MINIALVGNPNSGKTTLFNVLTGSTAHVGNWPGVTVDKKEGTYRKVNDHVNIIDLPGIYSLSPYTSEEVISRNYILDEKPDCIINIIDATNLERNLYLTTQLMEIGVPIVLALNMMDVVRKNGDTINKKELEKVFKLPVVEISAQKEENIDQLMEIVLLESTKSNNARSVLMESELGHLISDCKIAFETANVDHPLFHSIKLIENDEIEIKNHPNLVKTVDDFKNTFHDEVFGSDLEAVIADNRYKFITKHISKIRTKHKVEEAETQSDKIDKVLTNKWLGIPIFLIILFLVFHLTFSENLFYLGGLFENVAPSFEGTMFEGVIWTDAGINSPGAILFYLVDCLTAGLGEVIGGWLESTPLWIQSLIGDGVLGGIFGVLSFVPQILVLFLLFSILEDSGYMARVVFILDRIFRKFGLSGRAFIPMIMGFGCSVPAIINTRTLADDNERTATVRVIPFFSCGAKLPILTAIAGAIVGMMGVNNPDIITYSMYVLGMVTAIVTVLLMRKTTMRGAVPPFIMELPHYHMPQFKSLMLHLWDKLKHYIKKAFTVILASSIIIWFLSSFNWHYEFLPELLTFDGEEIVANVRMDESILAGLGSIFAPIFAPLGFGSNLQAFAWVFVVAAVTGLIAKENVIATFGTLAACVAGGLVASEDGVAEVSAMIQATGITVPALIAFIAFNMTTIPCFAAVATAKGELTSKKFKWTLVFWLVTSYIVSMMIFLIGTWWWTSIIFAILFVVAILIISFINKKSSLKTVK
ncbi:MAG: ferrous iron transport protein B [Bacilli bacterium]|nr:ferrous iron transport protein B [Bacilli bacterium]